MSLKINEIFYSIQGESSYAGSRCVFVRLTGCNLRCSYCDTQYAYHEGQEMEIDEIIEKVASYSCNLVEITGGEPLIQNETPDLIKKLLDTDFKVLLETNGSQDINRIDKHCVRIVDIKCPSSGEHEKNDFEYLRRLTERDEIKFVIGNRNDYDYAKEILLHGNPDLAVNIKVHFSPIYGKMHPKELARWILDDHLDVRLHMQLHKQIWNPEQRGV